MGQGIGVVKQAGAYIARFQGPLVDVNFYDTTAERKALSQLRHVSWLITDKEADAVFRIRPQEQCFLTNGITPVTRQQWGSLDAHWLKFSHVTAEEVDAKILALKTALFGGNVSAALDTFAELAAAITEDKSGIAALQNLIAGKAAVSDITSAITNLIGGASTDSNTLYKLELLAKAAQQAVASGVADGSITNAKMATDQKIGSISAAQNAYPQEERVALTSVERFLVNVGGKFAGILQRLGASEAITSSISQSISSLTGTVSSNTTRILALEARPIGGTSTGGGSGTASYPAQSGTTANMFLQSTGAAGAERWAAVVNNRVGWILNPKNELSRNQRFFKATSITRIEKDAGISTLSYSINGATAVQILFSGVVFTPAANTPLTFPAGALITWGVTYASGASEGAFEVEGTETN